MRPDLCNNHIVSNVELNEPAIEYTTSITTLEPENRNVFLNSDDLVGHFWDDYDIVVKVPRITISKKVKIKRITSYTPKIL